MKISIIGPCREALLTIGFLSTESHQMQEHRQVYTVFIVSTNTHCMPLARCAAQVSLSACNFPWYFSGCVNMTVNSRQHVAS